MTDEYEYRIAPNDARTIEVRVKRARGRQMTWRTWGSRHTPAEAEETMRQLEAAQANERSLQS